MLGDDVGIKQTAYIDAVAFENRIDMTSTTLYPDPTFPDPKSCIRIKCGMYKVIVEAVEYLSPEKIRELYDEDA